MIKLLSTDFDGTLVDPVATPTVSPALFALFKRLRGDGVLWAVNTGRALDHIVEGLAEHHFPLQPDFVLSSERHVFKPNRDGGWEDFGEWNAHCESDHDRLYAEARPLFEAIRRFLNDETAALWIDDYSGIGLVASSPEELDRITAFIDRQSAALPQFSYQRNTLYLRFCHLDYSKGAALGELARLTGIGADEIFAVGDHHNDLSMLDGRFAKWTACPANAEPEVKSAVRESGGHVANHDCSEGVVEALEFFLGNKKIR